MKDDVDFVFHGGSGSDPAAIEEAIMNGTIKMNTEEIQKVIAFKNEKEKKLEHENQILKLKYKNIEQNIQLRKDFSNKTFALIICWVIFIAFILLISGISSLLFGKSFLSDAIILASIGGTTATVLGLFAIVLHNLFPKD